MSDQEWEARPDGKGGYKITPKDDGTAGCCAILGGILILPFLLVGALAILPWGLMFAALETFPVLGVVIIIAVVVPIIYILKKRTRDVWKKHDTPVKIWGEIYARCMLAILIGIIAVAMIIMIVGIPGNVDTDDFYAYFEMVALLGIIGCPILPSAVYVYICNKKGGPSESPNTTSTSTTSFRKNGRSKSKKTSATSSAGSTGICTRCGGLTENGVCRYCGTKF